MQNSNEQIRGTVRRLVDKFSVRDYEAAHAAIDGLTAAGFDVDVKVTLPTPRGMGMGKTEFTLNGAVTVITVFRKEG